MAKTVTLNEVRDALLKISWDHNACRRGVKPLKVCYPNELIAELFGEEALNRNWISDDDERVGEKNGN